MREHGQLKRFRFCQFLVTVSLLFVVKVDAFSAGKMSGAKEIYGVPGSGWSSPKWNWGYASGTGYDCAMICRQQYSTREARSKLVDNLLAGDLNEPANFEEVKLVLGLVWQRGRWGGSDGGRGGYGQVLQQMAEASRYEKGDEAKCSKYLVEDMMERFNLLKPTPEQESSMKSLWSDCNNDASVAQHRCSGLVLQAMGFIDKGL